MVYVEVKKGWVWGFGVPTASTLMSVVVLVAGARCIGIRSQRGSALSRFVQVVVAAWRNHWKGVRVVRVDELYEVKTRESDIMVLEN
ncbi:putative bacterial ABC-type protein transporter [Dioscorea sansibarensis]